MLTTEKRQQKKLMVSENRNYIVKTVSDAKSIAMSWLKTINLENVVALGLPEIDDRYDVWRIPLRRERQTSKIGEIVVDAYSALIDGSKTTKPKLLETRLLKKMKRRSASINLLNTLSRRSEIPLDWETVPTCLMTCQR